MGQLTNELRPTKWDKVVGQEDTIELLKAIIKNPGNAPKILIFEGAMGSGKTSCARIFAREINGMTEQKFKETINNPSNHHYIEYDSSQVYFNEDNLHYLFTNLFSDYWKVVFLDEFQVVSNADQTRLLKPSEQVKGKVFVIFATTDVKKILKPLRSRAMELRFSTVPYEAILAHLNTVEHKYSKTISPEAKQYIAYRAHGHMRDVHMLVDRYFLQGDESFMRYAVTATDCLCNFFISALEQKPDVIKYLNMLVNMPLTQLQEDFDEFIIKCAQETIGIPSNNVNIKRVADAYGSNFKIVVDTYFQNWVRYMFVSDTLFHLSMMNFYKIVKDM